MNAVFRMTKRRMAVLAAWVGTGCAAFALPLDSARWFVNPSAAWPCAHDEADARWTPIDLQLRIEHGLATTEGNPVMVAGVFTNACAEVQGLTVTGGGSVRLMCNGQEIAPSMQTKKEQVFALPLVAGKNSLCLEVHGQEKHAGLFLTPVEMDYLSPPAAKQIEALKRSVDHLAKAYAAYPAAAIRQRIAALEKRLDDPAALEEIRALQIEALLRNNPVFDFDSILVRRTKRGGLPANWMGNAALPKEGYGNELARLSLKDFSFETVYRPEGGSAYVGDINLHFDAKKMLLSSISPADGTWQIFELNVDGSGLRQVTRTAGPDVDNYSGAYLPDGKSLVFCSTANMTGIPCIGGSGDVGTLYTADLSGAEMRQVTFEQDADWYPWVMDDGKVMYLRWEYTDNSHYFTRILMTMNPDGTQQRALYGSNSYWPSTMFYAKNVPGSTSKFTAIVSGHHGVAREGELVLFDVAQGEKDADGVVQRIPGYGKKVEPLIRDKYAVGNWPRFLHPYPLSDSYFLAAGQLSPTDGWGVYLLDRFDNIVLLKAEEKLCLYEPVPLKARKKPAAMPSRVQPGVPDAVLYIQDLHEGPGLAGIPRGTVKQLRLFTYSYSYRDMGGHNALTIEGGWDAKRLLGTVPVEADGSVMVRVPHSTPISIQPLDEKGAALQLMRSWLVAMPGESLSCVGCHESPRTPPLQRMTLAMKKGPQPLTPWRNERPHGFGFLREVQPVLDRRCVGCHDGSDAGRPNFKETGPISKGRAFAQSFHELHPFVNRPGCESDFRLLSPMDYHASTSELVQLLAKGHHGATLDAADWETLLTWIDLNVPYHPTWTDLKGDQKVDAIADRARELRRKYTGMADDPEWMPPASASRPAFQPPEKTKKTKPVPVPAVAGWPFDAAKAQQMQGTHSERKLELAPGISLRLRKVPAGSFAMGSDAGAADEQPVRAVEIKKPFWMAEAEITNEQFTPFNPAHDSRAIDQQWKDHVFPGYPANGPGMPVVRVSWNEAVAYCQWLSEKSGLKVTLPSEEQWEWACRAGSAAPFSFEINGFEKHANLADASIAKLAVQGVDPQPIPENKRSPLNDFVPRDASFDDGQLVPEGTARYLPNAWGLHDLHGNVAEWTSSDYDRTTKVVRGGSWRDRPKRATSSFRLGYAPYQPVYTVGFRVVVEED